MKSRRKKSSAPPESTPGTEGPPGEKGEQSIGKLLAEAGVKKTDRALQVGCADGVVSHELARLAGYVTVVEQSSELLAMAQEKVLQRGTDNLSVQQIEAGPLPFEDGAFDIVVSWGKIHQSDAPSVLFTEMTRVLKSPGRLLVADIVAAEDAARRDAHAKIEQMHSSLPITLRTAAQLRELFSPGASEIINHFQWTEYVDFEDWMPEQGTDVSVREKTSRLLSSAAKKKSTELDIEISGKNITFARRWMLIVAQKTGVT